MQKFWFSKLELAGRASEYRVGSTYPADFLSRSTSQKRGPCAAQGPVEQDSAREFFKGHGSAPGLSTL